MKTLPIAKQSFRRHDSRFENALLIAEGLDGYEPSEQSILDELSPNAKRAVLASRESDG